MDRSEHWDAVYTAEPEDRVGWYAPRLERSLAMIRAVTGPSAAIIDVGGGASTLADDLLGLGYTNVTVLDVSSVAQTVAKRRLGSRADAVTWLTDDVIGARLPDDRYDVWHDRAVFHFLTDPADRQTYAAIATRSIRKGGHLILATFALDGPARCSGLDVVRHSAETLGRDLGSEFVLERELRETHVTPSGTEQRFLYCSFRRRAGCRNKPESRTEKRPGPAARVAEKLSCDEEPC